MLSSSGFSCFIIWLPPNGTFFPNRRLFLSWFCFGFLWYHSCLIVFLVFTFICLFSFICSFVIYLFTGLFVVYLHYLSCLIVLLFSPLFVCYSSLFVVYLRYLSCLIVSLILPLLIILLHTVIFHLISSLFCLFHGETRWVDIYFLLSFSSRSSSSFVTFIYSLRSKILLHFAASLFSFV